MQLAKFSANIWSYITQKNLQIDESANNLREKVESFHISYNDNVKGVVYISSPLFWYLQLTSSATNFF